VSEGTDGRTLVHCHAGCEVKAICTALGIRLRDLFATPSKTRHGGNGAPRGQVVATYPYQDETGTLLFEVVRFEPKAFRQRRPDGKGGWIWSVSSVRKVPFRLPELLVAVKEGRRVIIAEGEKDVLALVQASFVATCNSGGAGKWPSDFAAYFKGADVVVIADKDAPGRAHAHDVAAKLLGVPAAVRVIELPDVGGKPVKDAADYFQAGETAAQLDAIANEAPLWQPPASESAQGVAASKHDELVVTFGQPIFFSEGRVTNINERFFAGLVQTGNDILFDPAERRFYEYAHGTGLWTPVSDEHVRERTAGQILAYGRERGLALESKLTAAKTAAILSALRGIAERRGAFVACPDRVHLANGVVRFGPDGRVGLTDFRLDDYSRNRCSVAFDPKAECSRFLNDLLLRALPRCDVDFLQRWLGLVLAGANPAQRFVILDGVAATGKSTIAQVVRRLVGVENCAQLRTELLAERFEAARFIGKTLLFAPDVPGDFLSRRGAPMLKALVGGDPLTAEAKFSNEVLALSGDFNVLITSNTRLRVRLDGDASAWRRRLVIIRFERPPPAVRIPNFAELLVREEGPGIVRWALAGLLRARIELAQAGDLRLTQEQEARVDALLQESDSVRRFVAECIEHGSGDITSAEAVEAYFRFCASRDWTPQPAKTVERSLTDALLEAHGVSRRHDIRRDGRNVRGWSGVILRQDEEVRETESEQLAPRYAERD